MREIADFAAALHLATKSLQFYTADHPKAVENISAVERHANTLLKDTGRLAVVAAKGKLLVQGQPVELNSPHVKAIAQTLEERGLGGFIMTAGVTSREIVELVRILSLKPQQLKDAGSAEEMLERAAVIHIRMSRVRYEALTEGEEVIWSKSLREGGGGGGPLSTAGGPQDLAAALRAFLLRTMQQRGDEGDASAGSGGGASDGSGDGPGGEADAGGDGAEEIARAAESLTAALQSEDFSKTDEAAKALLRQALTGLEPEVQLALLLNVGRIEHGDLRQLLAPAAQAMVSKGEAPIGGANVADPDFLSRVLTKLPQKDRGLELLRGRLDDLGISREQLDEVLDIIGWEKLSWSQKIEKLLAGDRILDFPSDKLLAFLKELVEAKRLEEVFYLLDRYGKGLQHDSYYIRLNVCDTLGQASMFMKTYGATPEIEQLLARLVLNHLLHETDARMQLTCGEAAANMLTAYVATGRSNVAQRHLERLESAVSAVSARNPNARGSYEAMIKGLGDPRRAAELIGQIYQADTETLNNQVLPLVTALGGAVAGALIEALGTEEDRNRRGRLLRALKAIGKPAYPHLLDALQSQVWYVVRNALNVLGDIGSPELVSHIGKRLTHGDARVRRTAARALGKIGGQEAETFLVQAVNENDPETQQEVLICLGSMKAQSAVPALLDIANARRDDAVRELALSTLAQIGSPTAIPTLSEIVRRKGLLGRDTLRVRVAAAKALAAIGTAEARDALQKAIETENDGAARDQLSQALAR